MWWIFIVSSCLFSLTSLSQENWLCSSGSSELRGDSVAACGVGEGDSEALSRKRAFDSAKTEFNEVCSPGTECYELKYAVEPKRSSCEHSLDGWKCYRLVVFRAVDVPRNVPTRKIPSQYSEMIGLRAALFGR